MRKARFSEVQIVTILKELKAGAKAAELCRPLAEVAFSPETLIGLFGDEKGAAAVCRAARVVQRNLGSIEYSRAMLEAKANPEYYNAVTAAAADALEAVNDARKALGDLSEIEDPLKKA